MEKESVMQDGQNAREELETIPIWLNYKRNSEIVQLATTWILKFGQS